MGKGPLLPELLGSERNTTGILFGTRHKSCFENNHDKTKHQMTSCYIRLCKALGATLASSQSSIK